MANATRIRFSLRSLLAATLIVSCVLAIPINNDYANSRIIRIVDAHGGKYRMSCDMPRLQGPNSLVYPASWQRYFRIERYFSRVESISNLNVESLTQDEVAILADEASVKSIHFVYHAGVPQQQIEMIEKLLRGKEVQFEDPYCY